MKECLKKSWYKILVAVEEYDKADWCALGLGALVLVCSFVLPTNFAIINIFKKLLIVVAAIWGLIYIIRIAYLWFRKRPIFDWLLVNGHFLRKVCCLVVLAPAVLTVGTSLIVETSSELHTDFEQLHNNYNTLSSESVVNEGDYPDLLWQTYFHFIDPGNQDLALYHRDRFWVAIVSILGMLLLNGLLVSSLIGWFDRRREKWLKGETPYNKFLSTTDHYVIIGGSDVVAGIVNQLKGKNEYIVIQTSRDVESFRRELFSTLKKEEAQRIIVRYGNRTSEKDIAELHIERAIEVYIIGEDTRTDDIESFHDTMNMECLDLLLNQYKKCDKGQKISALQDEVEKFRREIEKINTKSVSKDEKKGLRDSLYVENQGLIDSWKRLRNLRLKCYVMFEYQTTFAVFQSYDIKEIIDTYIDFKPFNYYEMWAQKVLINTELDETKLLNNFQNGGYLPLEGSAGIREDSNDYVHLIIVGMSRMGVAMAVEAAHLAHYPNYETNKVRTKITFIDKNAVEEKDFFMGRFKDLFELSHWRYGSVEDGKLSWSQSHSPSLYKYKHLGGDFLDIEWEFINGGIEHIEIQNYISRSLKPNARVTIAICLTESNRSQAAALYLKKDIYESNSVKQILVYNRYGSRIIDSLSNSNSVYPYCGKLRGFGCACHCLDGDILGRGERLGNEIARFYDGDPTLSELKFNVSGKSKSACMWSNVYNANTIWTKLRCIEYKPECFKDDSRSLNILANVEHNRWNVEELLMNFRYLTPKEQISAIGNSEKKSELKKKMAHLNICSNEKLLNIDAGAKGYDVSLTVCLSDIYQAQKNQSKKQ